MKQKPIYLIAVYSAKPKNPKMTHIKGYMSDPANIAWDESVHLTRGLKNRDAANARILLNITEQKVEKNTIGGNKSFIELFEYFYTNSSKEISNALRQLGVTVPEVTAPAEA
jgi:hypothetical protein